MFFGFRDAMQKYYMRLTGQVERQIQVHKSATPLRTCEKALQLYIKEQRRAASAIPLALQAMDTQVQNVDENVTIDVNDYMPDMSRMNRHRFLLHVQQGLFAPIFCYTWIWGGSTAGINPHVIWRVPIESQIEQRAEGMVKSQKKKTFSRRTPSFTTAEQNAQHFLQQWSTRTLSAAPH